MPIPQARKLRVQAGGDPLKMLYDFDPRRTEILFVAGDKMRNVPLADRLFERHLNLIEKEESNHG